MMPKIVSKSHSPHMVKTTLAQHKTRRPQESTGVVPAKDPSKVKLKNFHNSKVPMLGKLCVPWFVRVLGFLQLVGLTFVPWHRWFFLVGKIFINAHILRNPFIVGIPSIRVNRGAQVVSLYTYLWSQSKNHVGSIKSTFTFVSFLSPAFYRAGRPIEIRRLGVEASSLAQKS